MQKNPPISFSLAGKKDDAGELRALLKEIIPEHDQGKRRDVIKKVIAYMTLGVDVSPIFADMVLVSATSDIVQKKMIYLYLVTHASSRQDFALMVINTFLQDCRKDQPDAKIRGLALRSICSFRFEGAVESAYTAVENGFNDIDPYVRKTAVLGALKLFKYTKNLAFIDELYILIRDSDPLVSVNALLALDEMLREEGGIAINRKMVVFLLNRINDYSPLGQSAVLDMVSRWRSEDEAELLDIMSTLENNLQLSSSAFLLSCIKVYLNFTKHDLMLVRQVFTRIHPPLITHFLSAQSSKYFETAYVILSHIISLVKNGAYESFEASYKHFFLRYDDPSYLKLLKLDVITLLTSENNFYEVLEELESCLNDEVEVTKKAIKAVGTIGLEVPSSSRQAIYLLLSFLDVKVDHIVTQTLSTMKDLMRKYRTLSVEFIPQIQENLDFVKDFEGKAAIVWMLGEFGENIDEAPYILEQIVSSFDVKTSLVMAHALLTACVCLFLKRAPEMQETLGMIFQVVENSDDPDLKDRAGFYYKLLETDPYIAHEVANNPKHPISTFYEDENIYQSSFEEFNSLSVVYGRPLVTKKEFALQKWVNITSEDFEDMWLSMEDTANFTRMLKEIPILAQVEELCEEHNLHCLASGEQDDLLKFYFFAMDMKNQAYLSEICINRTQSTIHFLVKTQDQKRVNDFIQSLTAALGPFIN